MICCIAAAQLGSAAADKNPEAARDIMRTSTIRDGIHKAMRYHSKTHAANAGANLESSQPSMEGPAYQPSAQGSGPHGNPRCNIIIRHLVQLVYLRPAAVLRSQARVKPRG